MRASDLVLRARGLPTFAGVFQPRANALNFVRFLMASGVIVFHSFALSGTDIPWWPVYQLLGYVWVDGFFAISGYLILSSWMSRPSWWRYLSARALRIYPAFWVCLIVTALILAPVGTMLVTGDGYLSVLSPANASYVWANASLVMTQYDIAGTPLDVPYPGNWNGSLWTLAWEFLCYLAVLALGLIGAYRRRWVVPAIFLVVLGLSIATSFGWISNGFVVLGARFGLMFAAGMLVKRFERSIPLTWPLVAASAAVVAGTMFLPDYRLVGAVFVAYTVLGTGALLTHRALWFRNDISYGTYVYAFPLQQVLASAGVWHAGPWLFMVLSFALTWPAAAASWFAIEKPALRLKPGARRGPPTTLTTTPASRG